jgi:ParB-like chromosome segregation protein Spo0J
MGVTPVMSDKIENVCPGSLRPYPRNARTHSKKQVRQIAKSIRGFGFTAPVLIDRANMILAGHGRVAQPSTSVWRRCRAGASRR